MRTKLGDALLEAHAPYSYVCVECRKEEDNIVRCVDCGPQAYYCDTCCQDKHKHVVLHIPEKWQVGLTSFIKYKSYTYIYIYFYFKVILCA